MNRYLRILFFAALLGLLVIVGEMFLDSVRGQAKAVLKKGG